ncbi:MAG: zinc ribbon domain-containing protein [Phycisphaerales bacterium]
MGLQRRSEQRFNTPAKPDPLPLAAEEADSLAACPACTAELRRGAVLCVSCGARVGKIETTVSAAAPTRAACAKCGYDLSGVKEARCPECGSKAPIAPPRLEVMTEKEEWFASQVLWETCRNAVWVGIVGLTALFGIASWWYGARGVGFWAATIVPTWIAATIGYFFVGWIRQFLDTTIPIMLLQVLAVTIVGLAITQLVFPYTNGRIYSMRLIMAVPVLVAGATVIVMDDDDRVECLLVSLPITLACLVVPAVMLALLG